MALIIGELPKAQREKLEKTNAERKKNNEERIAKEVENKRRQEELELEKKKLKGALEREKAEAALNKLQKNRGSH